MLALNDIHIIKVKGGGKFTITALQVTVLLTAGAMGRKNILDVKVNDVEKRRYPTKHYVSAP